MFIAGFTIYLFSDALVVDYYVSGLIPVIGLAALNFVLLLIFRENYKVLFGILMAWDIIGSASLAFVCYLDLEDEWIHAYVILAVLLALGMIASLIWL